MADYNQYATSRSLLTGASNIDFLKSQLEDTKRRSTQSFAEGTRGANMRAAQMADLEGQIARGGIQDPAQASYLQGVKNAEQVLGAEGLGRLESDTQVQDVLSRYKDAATQGYDSTTLEAQRQAMNQGIDRSMQTSSRALSGQLARSGVKGAAAGNQQMGLAAQANMQRGNIERDIFLKNADFKNQALQKYGESLGQVKTFDLGQAAREKNIIMQSGFGFTQMGEAKASAATQAELAGKMAQAQSSAGKGKW
ncbi:hypothetical protein M0R04_11540 [Candidatus Dojkabacteria bacterium]|jgi:hypothetical protein|nr:hypothetical protein [Candidatus Dojkabacteria bacterium]